MQRFGGELHDSPKLFKAPINVGLSVVVPDDERNECGGEGAIKFHCGIPFFPK
jgi:hypothetical protein